MTDSEPGGVANGDTPQTAESNAKPSAGAPRVAKRAHRFLVPVLLVLATIVGIAATFAVWVNRQALNTSNWSSTSSKILEDKQVQTALSAYMVHELFSNVDVSADLQKVLPKQLQPLAGPAAGGLQQLAGQLAPKVLASPQAQAPWVQANVAAHKELLKVLNGGGPVVSTAVRGGDAEPAHARQPARGDPGRLESGRRGAVEAAGIDRGVGAGGGAAEARDHAAAGKRPAGDPAFKSAGDRTGHRQRRQAPGDRAARARDPAVRARRVRRTRPAPADVASERLVLRADRSGAAVDPQNRRRRGRQRPGQGSIEQAGRARRVEHRHVAAVQHRGRDDRVRDRDRGGRLACRPNPTGHRRYGSSWPRHCATARRSPTPRSAACCCSWCCGVRHRRFGMSGGSWCSPCCSRSASRCCDARPRSSSPGSSTATRWTIPERIEPKPVPAPAGHRRHHPRRPRHQSANLSGANPCLPPARAPRDTRAARRAARPRPDHQRRVPSRANPRHEQRHLTMWSTQTERANLIPRIRTSPDWLRCGCSLSACARGVGCSWEAWSSLCGVLAGASMGRWA